jgi:predicted transcriptional regulator
MPKTVTLRLKEDVYKIFSEAARADNRSISNLIETAALHNVREQQFVDDAEMAELLSDKKLLARIKQGSKEAAERKGRFVD